MLRLPNQRGFALLITITLLAFLVLLLVSLASLTRVETQVAGNSQRLSQARQNALFALNLAIGQLQKYAGPDQAVTARADITTAGTLTQPYLTGVWKTSNTTSTPDTWLVSGNESSPLAVTPSTAPNPATGTEPAADGSPGHAFLVGSNTVNAVAQRIRLAKQPIIAAAGTIPGLSAATTIGNYAWWIGDEGVKASSSLVNPLLGSSPISYDNTDPGGSGLGDNWADPVKRARLDQMQLVRPRLEHLFTQASPDTDWITAQPKITGLSQLLMLANNHPTASQLKDNFHAVTPLSQAVLADIPDGRLKLDLSDTTVSPDPSITKFLQTRVTPGTINGYSGYVTPVAPTNPTATTWPIYSLGPVMDMLGINLNFYISTADNKIHYNYTVSIQLWNPYTVDLHLDPANPITVEIGGLPSFTLTTDSGVTSNLVFTPSVITLTVPASTIWKPGETKNFRGGVTLGPESAPGAIFDGVVPGTPSDPTATTVTITFPGTSSYNGVLKVGGQTLSTYAPPNAGADSTTYSRNPSPPPSNGTAAGPTGWMLGYGFSFAEDVRVVISNTTSLSNIDCFDPRKPVMNGRYYHPQPSIWRRNNVALNTVPAFLSSSWGPGPRYPFYDLPRQEIVSLGMLSHVIGEKAYSVGNAWGGALNSVFDQYYFSTIPRNATAWTPENGLPLPNRYVEIYHPPSVTSIPLADLRSGGNATRYLLQKGAFNVNSTSIEAWKTVLGSKLPNWTYTSNETTGATTTITLDNVFFRSPHGAQQLIKPPLSSSTPSTNPNALNTINANQSSGRQLTNDEVSQLAGQIVARIRTRARPYLSLQEFVNSGDLDAAIDATTINQLVTRRYTPGGLTQADIVSLIAPFISPRSDTFVIRAYGDSQNPATSAVEGRAWCEAVVQRMPDLAGAPSAPIADVISPSSATYPFGRAFKIVSFRWLSPSDI